MIHHSSLIPPALVKYSLGSAESSSVFKHDLAFKTGFNHRALLSQPLQQANIIPFDAAED